MEGDTLRVQAAFQLESFPGSIYIYNSHHGINFDLSNHNENSEPPNQKRIRWLISINNLSQNNSLSTKKPTNQLTNRPTNQPNKTKKLPSSQEKNLRKTEKEKPNPTYSWTNTICHELWQHQLEKSVFPDELLNSY